MLYRSFPAAMISLIAIYYNKEKLVPLNAIKIKKWFYIRIFFNYLNIIFLVCCMIYLRAATAACFSSSAPIFIILLSVCILKEKFYWKYLIGVVICFFGTSMIVLNERKNNYDNDIKDSTDIDNYKTLHIFYGCIFGVLHILTNSLVAVAQRIVSVEKIPFHTQFYYIGVSNSFCAILYCIITFEFNFHLNFCLFGSLNIFLFYLSGRYLNKALENIPVSKMTPIFYVSTIVVFICGVLFLNEMIYLTDIIGSLMIVGCNVYTSVQK